MRSRAAWRVRWSRGAQTSGGDHLTRAFVQGDGVAGRSWPAPRGPGVFVAASGHNEVVEGVVERRYGSGGALGQHLTTTSAVNAHWPLPRQRVHRRVKTRTPEAEAVWMLVPIAKAAPKPRWATATARTSCFVVLNPPLNPEKWAEPCAITVCTRGPGRRSGSTATTPPAAATPTALTRFQGYSGRPALGATPDRGL